ncbi:MAG: tetratricopeptide repeat protein [Gemmatimonadaceae bacterium]
MNAPSLPAADDLTTLLADGIRYDRSGVVTRARDCFAEVTERWRENPAVAAEAWWRLANVQRLQSQWDDALESARTSATLARANQLLDVEADALNIEAVVWWTRGEFAKARGLFQRMLALAQSPTTRAKALQNLGSLAAEEHDYETAERLFTDSRETYRLTNDARGEACSLLNIGLMQAERGDPAQARETLEQAVMQSRHSGDLELHASALLNLGIALGALGDLAEAEERVTTAYGQFTIADIPMLRVRCLLQLAKFARRRGEPAAAQVCLQHARKVATRGELPIELHQIDEQLAQLAAT